MIKKTEPSGTVKAAAIIFLLLTIVIIGRLFYLQVIQHNYYATFALSAHEIYKQIHPRRGNIYFSDARNNQEYLAATNRQYYTLYVVPNKIPKEVVASTTEKIATLLDIADEAEKKTIQEKLNKDNDPYEVIAKKIPEDKKQMIEKENIIGLGFAPVEFRYYPENNLAAGTLGFCRFDDTGSDLIGNYGIEGYWNKTLSGKKGFFFGEKGALGSWITTNGLTKVDAQDGADIVLTLDRTLQFQACAALKKEMENNKAKNAALVMMNPSTGAILALCSLPDYNPNNFSEVANPEQYNNAAIFIPYEPGSDFKPITMSMALDQNLVSPHTTFTDPCVRHIDGYDIKNSSEKCFGTQTMTQVLENSINTGMIFVVEKLGRQKFHDYAEKFGLGEKTGIELNTEMPGDTTALDKKGAIYSAVGSFGQGISVTPLQLATAYSALANQGNMPKPYIVREIRYSNGKVEKTTPKISAGIISERASKLITGMLISVIENHYKSARIPNYYVAGKTGTAQVAEGGGYSETRTNHTFAGFAPASDPRVVLVVKFGEPQRKWAEQTAMPIFREVMKFALNYYAAPKDKK